MCSIRLVAALAAIFVLSACAPTSRFDTSNYAPTRSAESIADY